MPCDAMDVGSYAIARRRVERRPAPDPDRPVPLDLKAFQPWGKPSIRAQSQAIHTESRAEEQSVGSLSVVESFNDLDSCIQDVCMALGKPSDAEHWTEYLRGHWIYDVGRLRLLDQSEWESLKLPPGFQKELHRRIRHSDSVLRRAQGYPERTSRSVAAPPERVSGIVAAAPSADLDNLRAELTSRYGSDWTSNLRSALIGPNATRKSRSRTIDLKTVREALKKLGVSCSDSVLVCVLRIAGVNPAIEDVLKVVSRRLKPSHEDAIKTAFNKLADGAMVISMETLRKVWVQPSPFLDDAETRARESLSGVFLRWRGLQHVGEPEFLLAHQGASDAFNGTDDDFAKLIRKTWGLGGEVEPVVSASRNEPQAMVSKEKHRIADLPPDLHGSLGGLREAFKRRGPSALQFFSQEVKRLPCTVDSLLGALQQIVPDDFELQQKLRISKPELRRLAEAFSHPHGEADGLIAVLGSELSPWRTLVLHEVFRSIMTEDGRVQGKSAKILLRQCNLKMLSKCHLREKVAQLSHLMQDIIRNLESAGPETILRESNFIRFHVVLSRSVNSDDVFQEIVRVFWGVGSPSYAQLNSKYRMRNQSSSIHHARQGLAGG